MTKLFRQIIFIIFLVVLLFVFSGILTIKREVIIDKSSVFHHSSRLIISASPSALSDKEWINLLFLGIPGQSNNAPFLTDTIIVGSYNQKTKKGFMVSIPRDLVVKDPGSNSYRKINSIYQQYGLEEIQKTLKKITGLSFDYSIVLDLDAVKEIIDQIGGIDVFVEKDIYDPAFPGPNNSYQLFTLKKGWQHLDGETALKYLRTRHDPGGDFSRMQRQQKVLAALKDKISSLHPLWDFNVVLDIFKTISNHLETNLSLTHIKALWAIIKDINLENINFKVLDGSTGLIVSDSMMFGNEKAYILKPTAGLENYQEIKSFITSLFEK